MAAAAHAALACAGAGGEWVMLTWIAYDTTAEMIGLAAARESAADGADRCARSVSDCESVWVVCGDDARAVRH